jgi:hypothetical protein
LKGGCVSKQVAKVDIYIKRVPLQHFRTFRAQAAQQPQDLRSHSEPRYPIAVAPSSGLVVEDSGTSLLGDWGCNAVALQPLRKDATAAIRPNTPTQNCCKKGLIVSLRVLNKGRMTSAKIWAARSGKGTWLTSSLKRPFFSDLVRLSNQPKDSKDTGGIIKITTCQWIVSGKYPTLTATSLQYASHLWESSSFSEVFGPVLFALRKVRSLIFKSMRSSRRCANWRTT